MQTYRAYVLCQLILAFNLASSDIAIYRTKNGIQANCLESDSYASCYLGENAKIISSYKAVNESCIVLPEEIEPKSKECLKIANLLQGKDQNINGTIRFDFPSNRQNFFWKEMDLQLLKLQIGDNFDSLPVRPHRNLTKLRMIHFDIPEVYGDFTLPTKIFDTLSNLESLEFEIYYSLRHHATITNLKSDYFRCLNKLKHLQLEGADMSQLHEDVFSSLKILTSLSLRFNTLQSLPRDLLAAQSKLTVLDLSYNRLQYLPEGLFYRTPNLWKLDLSSNQFSSISSIIPNIRPLRFLYKLDLSNNSFETIMGDGYYTNETIFSSFAHRNTSILHLLDEVPIDYFSYKATEMEEKERTVIEIDLNFNRISRFDLDLVTNAHLKSPFSIDLGWNEINHIYAFSPSIFNVKQSCKQEILLDGNPLKCDCTLAWINSNNYCSIVKGQKCNEQLCDWKPAFCPDRCACSADAAVLQINCTGADMETIGTLPRPEQFAGIENVTLSISQNRFKELPSNTTFGYANVTHLNASQNHIAELLSSQLPPNLTVLDVSHNRLEDLSDDFLFSRLSKSPKLQELYLAHNPWKCDCSAKPFLLAVHFNRDHIPDAEQLICANPEKGRLLDIDVDAICADGSFYIIIAGVIAGAVIVLITIIALYFKYQLQVQVWLYANKIRLCFINEHKLDKDKTFDAFISYAHQDENFVNRTLLPQLERGDPPYRICTHERNWLAGAYIAEQIVESVAQSRRTIIVLSQHFIESDWARMEFRTAHQSSLNEGRSRIIIIKYGELTNTELLDRELKAYLDMNTYLMWEDCEWFWSKLRYAMPHKKGEARDAGMLELREKSYVIGQVERNRSRDGKN